MACSRLPIDWNWKAGDQAVEIIGNLTLAMNYFSCGLYFFDGTYKVVEFEKDMTLYHGSDTLIQKKIDLPVGTTPGRVAPAWFGDQDTARLYANDPSKLSAFRLKKSARFLILDDSYNIWKLLNSTDIPDSTKLNLRSMFSLPSDVSMLLPSMRMDALRLDKKRNSTREHDLPFSQVFCTNVASTLGYAGYAANIQLEETTNSPTFHLEFMFCNIVEYLERDRANKHDYYHADVEPKSRVRIFVDELKSIPDGLFERTTWAVLYGERLMDNCPSTIPLDRRLVSIACFLGAAMTEQACRLPEDKPSDFILGYKAMHSRNIYIDISSLIADDLKLIEVERRRMLAVLLNIYVNYIRFDDNKATATLTEYMDFINSAATTYDIVPTASLHLSIAVIGESIMSARDLPFDYNSLTFANVKSRYLPFIFNLPKSILSVDGASTDDGDMIIALINIRRLGIFDAIVNKITYDGRTELSSS